MDVLTAFLNPELEEDEFVKLPSDYHFNGEVCKLRKAIHGLKQASRAWNKQLDSVIKKFGFVQSNHDPCLYYKRGENVLLIIAAYVDDLLILSNDTGQKERVKTDLMTEFRMKDFGQIHFCLGMRIEINAEKQTISVDQTKYILSLLNRFGMADCNEVSIPLDLNQDLFVSGEADENLKVPY